MSQKEKLLKTVEEYEKAVRRQIKTQNKAREERKA